MHLFLGAKNEVGLTECSEYRKKYITEVRVVEIYRKVADILNVKQNKIKGAFCLRFQFCRCFNSRTK